MSLFTAIYQLSNDPATIASKMDLPIELARLLSSKGYRFDSTDCTLGGTGAITGDGFDRIALMWGDLVIVKALTSIPLADVPTYLESPDKVYGLIPDNCIIKPRAEYLESFYKEFVHGLLTSRLEVGI